MNNNQQIIKGIEADLEKANQSKNDIPSSIGMFSIKSAYQTIIEASSRPDPDKLWMELWYEGEVCCLFADSNVGKSIYAVQIAEHISRTQRVLYFDFELSDKQFQLRYTDDKTKEIYHFPPDLYRVEINTEACTSENFEDVLIENIEQTALQTEAHVLIIDNLTYLCNTSEKGDAAGELMMRLMKLKRQYGWSILVLAHTPKRQLTNPITQNDLAGSKKLFNFFDSVFSIGKSAKDEDLRYIKQLKVRYGSYTLGSENVQICTIEKQNSFLQFISHGYSTEMEHLKIPTEKQKESEIERIKELKSKGCSYREIANNIGCSLSKVQRSLK